jgi:phospholipid transport system substrate-binding protein
MVAAAALVLLLMLPCGAWAQQDALRTVKLHVDNVLDVLRDPALKGPKGEKEKEARIVAESDKLFDYIELSKRTLGLSWNRLSQEQRREFVKLYKKRLQDTYVDRITAYTNEKVEFTEAVPLGGGAVEVRSVVLTKTAQVPIYYRAMGEGGQWRVYDVIIEGVSLIANYRSQFREILANQGPEGLLATLRKKE